MTPTRFIELKRKRLRSDEHFSPDEDMKESFFFFLEAFCTKRKIVSDNPQSISQVDLRNMCPPTRKQVITTESALVHLAGSLYKSWLRKVKE